MPQATRRELARRGHNVQTVGPLDRPWSVNVVRFEADFWQAGSDPRRDGYAIAFFGLVCVRRLQRSRVEVGLEPGHFAVL